MVPENEPLSAFAVQSARLSKNARKKKKQKAKKTSEPTILTKEQKKELLLKKRAKIETLAKKTNKTVAPKKMKSLQKVKEIPKAVDAPKKKKKKPLKTKSPTPSNGLNSSTSKNNAKVNKKNVKNEEDPKDLEENKEFSGEETFKRLINPLDPAKFFTDYWEKRPVCIKSNGYNKRFEELMSTPMMDEMLRQNVMLFGRDVDVTTYTDGVRETHNPEARAHANVVWDYYSNGCSVRFLSPQSYRSGSSLRRLNTSLQEYFGTFVGANTYLTPPGSQGFAPHFDDIEAFVLQIEGTKKWKIYKPRNPNEKLPRYSSKNFSPEDLEDPPILEVTLKPGDVLYFPRGFIHQARTEHNEHSLHVTISVYQKTAWCDLLEKAIPTTLQRAIADDVDFRRGLPFNYLNMAGFAHKNSPERKNLILYMKKLMTKLINYVDIDEAIDKIGVDFIQHSLPPFLPAADAVRSVVDSGIKMEQNGRLNFRFEMTQETQVRLIRPNCSRFLPENVKLEDGTTELQHRLYVNVDNPLEYNEDEPQFLILPESLVTAMKYLIQAYPNFTPINDLPCETDEDKMILASDLWDRGVLMVDSPNEEEKNGLINTRGMFSKSNNEAEDDSEEEMQDDSEEKMSTSFLRFIDGNDSDDSDAYESFNTNDSDD